MPHFTSNSHISSAMVCFTSLTDANVLTCCLFYGTKENAVGPCLSYPPLSWFRTGRIEPKTYRDVICIICI